MSGWSFTRHIPADDGNGFYWTDGMVAENFVAGIYVGAERKGDFYHEGVYGKCDGFVYFIAIGDPYISHVKVGYTKGDPALRLKALQTGCPFPLKILGFIIGNEDQERELHRVFEQYRTVGEWFEFSDYVENTVRSLLEGTVFA